MRNLTAFLLLATASLANAQKITLDTVFLRKQDTFFLEVNAREFADGSAVTTSKRLGDANAVISHYETELEEIGQREATDLAAVERLRGQKNRLIGLMAQVKTETGGSPLDSLQKDVTEFTDGEWYIITSSEVLPLLFKNNGVLGWTIDLLSGEAIPIGNTLRLLDWPKQGGPPTDFFKKDGLFVSADGATYLKNALAKAEAQGIELKASKSVKAPAPTLKQRAEECLLNRQLMRRNLSAFPPGDYRWDGKKLTLIPAKKPAKKK